MICSFQDAAIRKRLIQLESMRLQMHAHVSVLHKAGYVDQVSALMKLLAALDEQIQAFLAMRPLAPHSHNYL
jgi:hypothetical protein